MADLDLPKICQSAVALARQNGEDFDYTPESILAGQNQLFRQGRLTDIYVWNLSVMTGVYLGQTLLYCGLADRGYSWKQDRDGVPMLADGKGNYVAAVYQVHRRIRGEEDDNVRAFFESVLDAAEGLWKQQ